MKEDILRSIVSAQADLVENLKNAGNVMHWGPSPATFSRHPKARDSGAGSLNAFLSSLEVSRMDKA